MHEGDACPPCRPPPVHDRNNVTCMLINTNVAELVTQVWRQLVHMQPQEQPGTAVYICMLTQVLPAASLALSQHLFEYCAGQLLAMKISQRTVALSGGMLFLLFAAHNLIYGSAT